MAVAVENVITDNSNSDSPSITLAGTGANRLIVLILVSTNTSNVTHSGWTLNSVAADGSGTLGVDGGRAVVTSYAYWLDTNHPGSGSFTIAYTGEGTFPIWTIYELSGVNQTTPIGTPATNTAINQIDGANLTATLSGESGEFVLSYCATGDAASSSTGSTAPANLDGTTYTTTLSQGTVSVDTDTAAASASEDYTWTLSHDGVNIIDSCVASAFAVYAAGAVATSIPVIRNQYAYQNMPTLLTR